VFPDDGFPELLNVHPKRLLLQHFQFESRHHERHSSGNVSRPRLKDYQCTIAVQFLQRYLLQPVGIIHICHCIPRCDDLFQSRVYLHKQLEVEVNQDYLEAVVERSLHGFIAESGHFYRVPHQDDQWDLRYGQHYHMWAPMPNLPVFLHTATPSNQRHQLQNRVYLGKQIRYRTCL
jgi:hypothetical protein